MQYVLTFIAGLAAGALVAARRRRADEAAAKRRAKLLGIHLQALERTVRTLVTEDGEISPAERAVVRQYRIMWNDKLQEEERERKR